MRMFHSRRRNHRGAAALEFALIAPVLFAMLFGIIEMAFLMRDCACVVDVPGPRRRPDGVRQRQTGAPGGINEDRRLRHRRARRPTRRCSPSWPPTPIQKAGSALPKDSIKEFWVYKANDKGYPGRQRQHHDDAVRRNCVKYKWVPAKDQFRYYQRHLARRTVNACANNNPDSVGSTSWPATTSSPASSAAPLTSRTTRSSRSSRCRP